MKLTSREEQIMDYLWEHGTSFVKDIKASFKDPQPHYNTVSTMVRNLEQKKMVDHEDFGTTYRYFALISKEEFVKGNLKRDVKKYFGNSYKSLVSSLVESDDLTLKEIKELIELAKKRKQ
ncbi:MAG: BlaI/MecI/CopY family transcriptional regulator [Bacteroidales bacterium]|nr:BlaI/MecI/CopY family transcriptional regulator [Bacteroidales bacterium]